MLKIIREYLESIIKVLVEKGFDEKCFTVYNNDREFYDTKYGIVPSIKIPTPTIQMAMKWL